MQTATPVQSSGHIASQPTTRALAEPPEPHQPIASTALLRGSKVVDISHNGKVYRLHATRLGKLILTL